MNSIRLPSLALFASFTLLSTAAVFAADHSSGKAIKSQTSATTATAPYPGLDGNRAVSLQAGQSLPVLDIREGGEVTLSDSDIVKTPWSSKSFNSRGKVQLVQYVAANRGAVRQNKAFTDSLIEKQFSSEQLDTTVIVHFADTMSLLKGIVVNRIAKNKAKHETIHFVIDDDSLGLQRWGMKNKSFAIIVLDESGKVLFAKDGPLSNLEVESTIELIESHVS
jgi:YtfJ family uncharacterized protein